MSSKVIVLCLLAGLLMLVPSALGDKPKTDPQRTTETQPTPHPTPPTTKPTSQEVIEDPATSNACDAHEFICDNRKCANKIFICDGDNNCGDNSDEKDCGERQDGSRCLPTHFDCGGQHQSDFVCIQKSFYCDGLVDCDSSDDEANCSRPKITESTTKPVTISVGETVHCICATVGVPNPVISWRFNEKRLPNTTKVTVQALNGRSQLTVTNATKALSGSYRCEAHNKGGATHAYEPCDINVVVPGEVCKPPKFNVAALSKDECRKCFCMGITSDCQSSKFYKKQIIGKFPSSKDFGGFRLVDEDGNEVDTKLYRQESDALTVVNVTGNKNFYWKLPSKYLGKKFVSYGGVLHFHLKYSSQSTLGKEAVILRTGRQIVDQSKDVVIEGDGVTLTYRHILVPQPNEFMFIITPIVEEVWKTSDGRRASRADLMRVLFNVTSIRIRAGLNVSDDYKTISIKDVSLDAAVPLDTGLGQSIFIEECRCPHGYRGLSCEFCADDYIRDPDAESFPVRCIRCPCHGHSDKCHPTNGTCFDCNNNTQGSHCEKCLPGFYGDATKGTPQDCLPCPCPRDSPPNRFSKTCFLESDGQSTCDACQPEYTGRNCERCSTNYTGNPLKGEKCLPKGPESCDARGSYSVKPDKDTRTCRCKPYVTGETCNACRPGFFGLGLDPYGGCLSCFCNGVSDECTSSSLNKTRVVMHFATRLPQGIVITNRDEKIRITDFLYNPNTDEIVHQFNRSEPLFWSLPTRYLGNKLSSYGGLLSFVASYDSSQSGKTLTVFLKGQSLSIKNTQKINYGREQLQEMMVVIKEGLWLTLDNKVASRDELMVVLSSVKSILIQASHKGTSQASIREVSLDVALNQPTNRSRAVRVEHCACPKGYTGLSCESCREGYYRTKTGRLIGTCSKCSCNRHSEDCDQTSGVCKGCLHNTYGDHCEKCKSSFYGDPSVGSEIDCRPCACPKTKPPNRFSKTCFLAKDGYHTCDACPVGYTGRKCEKCLKPFIGDPTVVGDFCKFEEDCGCDPRGSVNNSCDPFTRQCFCKANVEGKRCNKCKPFYFDLDSSHPHGCLPCFCFGVTSQCKCARGYRDKVSLSYGGGHYNGIQGAVRLGDHRGVIVVNNGILLVGEPPHYVYNRFDRLPRKTFYWYLPQQFLGDKISSYGGYLRYILSHDMLLGGHMTKDSDLEIRGHGLVLIHKMQILPPGGLETLYQVKLVESSFTFENGPVASREDFIIALSVIESIVIRATYSTSTYQASLYSVSMDVVSAHEVASEQVNAVEQCACPTPYTGLSCQKCSRGYTRYKPGPSFSRCVRCSCNHHTLECDPESGKCLSCQDNTAGDHCELCKDGYYGDASKGTPSDCKKCACPLDIPTNQFSRTCRIDVDGYPTCTACQTGYMGRDCARCSQGYTGNPRSPGGKCEKIPEELLPKATVWPSYRKDSEGSRAVFYCLSTGKQPLTVTWSRINNKPLSPRAQTDSRAINIPNVQKKDEGSYVCSVKNDYGQHTARGTLSVLARPQDPITVSVTPKTLHISTGQTAVFICKAKSLTYHTLKWAKGESDSLPAGAVDNDGVLSIKSVRRMHTGTYTCTGSNQYSFDQITVQLRVAAIITPQVSITPRFLTVDEGDRVLFRCSASGFPPPDLQWTGGPGGRIPKDVLLLKGNSVFQILKVKKEHEGEYFCIAKNDGAVGRMRTVLNVRAVGSVPNVQISPKTLSVTEGEVAEFKCTASGNPQPSIGWSRVEGAIPDSSTTIDGVLRIDPSSLNDEGTYVCTVANRFGAVAENAVLTVEQDTGIPPSASVFPDEITVKEGHTVVITCEIDGNPLPSVSWNRVGGVLRENHVIKGNQLLIVNITEKDEGMYVCIAQNKKGVKQVTAIIRVEKNVMPKIEIMPAPNLTVTGGDTVVFRCMVKEGTPTPSVIWMDGDENPLNRSTAHVKNDMLMITRASGEDEGRYVCRATNSLGSVFAEAVLAVQAEPRVVVTPSSPYVVPVGSQVSLICSATGDPSPSVQWLLPTSSKPLSKPVEVKPGVFQLVIEEIKMEDQGSYTCVAKNIVGEVQDTLDIVVTPLVKKPPQVTVQPTYTTVLEGQRVVFQCNVSGIPTPSASWSRKGGDLPDTTVQSEPGYLRLESVSASDQGEYMCTATNSEGSAAGSVKLDILVSPKISITPQQVSVILGQSIRLYCVSQPPLPLTWTKINGTISDEAVIDGGVLIVDETNIHDTGKYRCQASNKAGSSEVVAMVTVLEAPKVKVSPTDHVGTLGSNVTFTCEATGIPDPVITWTKDGGSLPQTHVIDDGSLIMFDLSGKDQGRYLCTATNAAGHEEEDVALIIEELPSVSIIGGTSVKTVPVGGNLTLQCKGTGIPPPSTRWGRTSDQLPNDVVVEQGLLHIINAKPSYGGTYRCSVANRVGSVQAQIVIFIQDAPQVTITPQVRKVKLGETADFKCIASGSPSPEVTWHRLNGSLPVHHTIKGGQLLISSITLDDVGIYICRASNMEGIAESSATIALKGIIPRFEQNPVSYMILSTLTKDSLNFTMEIFFSPEIADGLIFYNDQHDNGSIGDFVSFGMSAGLAEFRFDLGSRGPAIIRSKYPLILYNWYTVKLTRSETEGTLQVNDEETRRGTSKGQTTQLNLDQPLFVGGVKNFSLISSLAGFTKGFIGCVSYITVNGEYLGLGNPLERVGVSDCEPCTNNPCKNAGHCDDINEPPGFTCQCRPGFTGSLCEGYGNGCYPGACENGRCVNLDNAAGFKCVCAVGYTGQRCEHGTKIETPMFEGTSFMSYPSIQGALVDIKLSMRFMAHEGRNMLLLYNGQKNFPERGDFISIAIVNGKVEFRYDLGIGSAVIRSNTNITTGKWHNIVVERLHRDGSLTLDSEPAVKDQAPCCSIGLNVALPLYIGGVTNLTTIDATKLGVDSGFFGCISDVSVDDSEIDLVNTYLDMRSVKQCKDCMSPCEIGPCTNNGTCVSQGQTGYSCVCAQGFTGKNCEFSLVGPGKNRTCLNGGLPFPPSGRVCDCRLGFGGERCEKVVQIEDTLSFSGDGYVQYPKAVMKRILGKLESITLNIKTTSSDGLIYWQGQKIGASKGDYLSIGLNDGYLQLQYDLGAGAAELRSRRKVNDGTWHFVKISRQSQKGSLLVDKDELVDGLSPEGARSLNSPGPIFLGGGQDIESLTYGQYSDSYTGCLGGVYLQSRALKLRNDALQGYNVLPCTNGDKIPPRETT